MSSEVLPALLSVGSGIRTLGHAAKKEGVVKVVRKYAASMADSIRGWRRTLMQIETHGGLDGYLFSVDVDLTQLFATDDAEDLQAAFEIWRRTQDAQAEA
jgi:hypothetical protein